MVQEGAFWLLGRVADIVVGFVGARFVAICELLLGMPGLMVDRGRLMGGWVVAYWQIYSGRWRWVIDFLLLDLVGTLSDLLPPCG